MADEKAIPFESFAALRADHSRLLKARASKEPGATPPTEEEVSLFLARALATGRRLDAPSERESAQSAMDYWTATLCTLPHRTVRKAAFSTGTGDGTVDMCVLLEPFDVATAKRVVADAEAWFVSLSPDDQATVRRVLMRLVVLSADGKTFASAPAPRSALDSFGPPERVEALLATLVEKQLVRLPPGETPTVALRYDASMREWERLAGWLDKRLRFRQAVKYWRANGDAPAALIRDEPLDEAREYHDKDHLEEQFVATSGNRAKEQDRIERHLHRWKFWLAAALACVFAFVAVQSWWAKSASNAASNAALAAEQAKKEFVTMQMDGLIADGLADSISMSALIELLTKHDAHYAKKLLVVQILGQLVSSPSEEAWDIAQKTWAVLEIDLRNDPAPGKSFWFENDFFPGKAEKGVPTTNRDRIALLTKSRRQSRDHRIELYWISTDLKKWLEPRLPKGVKGRWYSVACSTAATLAKAAREKRAFEEVAAFEGLFWRLYLGEMVLVESEAVEGKMVRFGRLLDEWEKLGGDAKALAELAEKMQQAADELKKACERDTSEVAPASKDTRR